MPLTKRKIFTPFVLFFSGLLIPINWYLSPQDFNLPLDLTNAKSLIDKGQFGAAAIYLIDYLAKQKDYTLKDCQEVEYCLNKCNQESCKNNLPLQYDEVLELKFLLNSFRVDTYQGQFLPCSNSYKLFQEISHICFKEENKHYFQNCSFTEQEPTGLLMEQLQKTQKKQFPILRRHFYIQLKKRLALKRFGGVELSLSEDALNQKLILYHPSFDKIENIDPYFNKIKEFAFQMRFRALVFRSDTTSIDKPLSICEDGQTCRECYDIDKEPGGAIVVADVI